jgi:hypothetical protein
VSSNEPDAGSSGVDSGKEVTSGLVVAGGHSAKELELSEEVFNQVTSFVKLLVVIPLHLAVGLGRDKDNLARPLPGNHNPLIGIEAFIREQAVGFQLWQQHIGSFQVAGLAAGEMKASGVAEGIDGSVNLGAQSAFTAPDGLVCAPFFSAPALCWWARTMVESIIAYSLSAS